jgi:hypothetical protein
MSRFFSLKMLNPHYFLTINVMALFFIFKIQSGLKWGVKMMNRLDEYKVGKDIV